MSKISYKTLYQLTVEEIDKRVTFNNTVPYASQGSRDLIAPITGNGREGASSAELITAIQNLLTDSIPSNVLSGLIVTATTPISATVNISSGKGVVGGFIYELTADTTVTIPFDSTCSVFYITLYKDRILIEKTYSTNKLTIAKIIVPNPGTTAYVQNTKDESWNAYIVNFKEYKLYGYNNTFEEDTIELLRDNISPILADNLIGNIRLSEDLKITNTQGTVELDSAGMKIYDVDDNVLAKFNRNGVFLYDTSGIELAKFTGTEARIGNIKIVTNALQSGNFVSGLRGFRIKDDGNTEFNNVDVRGRIQATTGEIGGWTVTAASLYATTTGTIKTGVTVGSGSNGVILDKDGLRVYDSILGVVVNLPSDGSAPSFASGTIESTTFEINTNSVLRTSSTVGDGTSNSAGILINNTGLYGCEGSQSLQNANLKALIDGSITLKGTILASAGTIGSTTITATKMTGGLIEGSLLRSSIFETSDTTPRVRIDTNGLYFQETTNVGKYGSSGSGSYGFQYGDGTMYGGGVLAYLFNSNFPILSIERERVIADVRFYNRSTDPVSGTHKIGDMICVNGKLKICTTAGTPGIFTIVGTQS